MKITRWSIRNLEKPNLRDFQKKTFSFFFCFTFFQFLFFLALINFKDFLISNCEVLEFSLPRYFALFEIFSILTN